MGNCNPTLSFLPLHQNSVFFLLASKCPTIYTTCYHQNGGCVSSSQALRCTILCPGALERFTCSATCLSCHVQYTYDIVAK